MPDKKPETILFSDGARGVYIPQHFAETIRRDAVQGVTNAQWPYLELGPNQSDSDDYWMTWDEVLNDATITDDNGVVYRLYQDGDLWLIPEGMEWREETESFEWPTGQDRESYSDDQDRESYS